MDGADDGGDILRETFFVWDFVGFTVLWEELGLGVFSATLAIRMSLLCPFSGILASPIPEPECLSGCGYATLRYLSFVGLSCLRLILHYSNQSHGQKHA